MGNKKLRTKNFVTEKTTGIEPAVAEPVEAPKPPVI